MILTAIWDQYCENGEWILRRVLHHRFQKSPTRSALERMGGSIVFESLSNGLELYQLTLLGVLLTDKGRQAEDLITAYLGYVRDKFLNDPTFDTIRSRELESALQLTASQSKILHKLVHLGRFWGKDASASQDLWKVGVPSDVDDLPSVQDLRAFVHQRAMESFSPSAPTDESGRIRHLMHPPNARAGDENRPSFTQAANSSACEPEGQAKKHLSLLEPPTRPPIRVEKSTRTIGRQILIGLIVAVLASGTAPWWWEWVTERMSNTRESQPIQSPRPEAPPIVSKGQERTWKIYRVWGNSHPEIMQRYGQPKSLKFVSIHEQHFKTGYIGYNVTDGWSVLLYRLNKEFRRLPNPGVQLTPGSGRQVNETLFEELTSGMSADDKTLYRTLIDNRVRSADFHGVGIIGGIATLYIRERLYDAFGPPEENEKLIHDVLHASGDQYEVFVGLPHGLGGPTARAPKSVYVLHHDGRYERHVEFPERYLK